MTTVKDAVRLDPDQRQQVNVLTIKAEWDDVDALDALLDGLQRLAAQGRWSPDADSEARRLALLPQTPPVAWDDLMRQGAYQHALEWVAAA